MMAFTQRQMLVVHAVLQAPDPLPRDPGQDELFIAAVRSEFPNIIGRQMLPREAPSQVPHLIMGGTSSQVALAAAQADFEVRFYGEYLRDMDRGLEYVERKIGTMLAGYQAMGVEPAMVGAIATLHFGMEGSNEDAVRHIMSTHLRTELDPATVQDAQAKVALKVRDTYFVNLTVSNYESRTFERPIMPGVREVRIRPWEGDVDDVGLELLVDINNHLEARVAKAHPKVTEEGVGAVIGMLREIATATGPEFAETGTVSADVLEGSRQ